MKALPANRVAALAAFLAGLGGCATALAGVWPSPATTEIALIGGSVATFGAPLAHIVGSWLWDRTPAGQASALQAHQLPRDATSPDDPDPGVWLSNRQPVPDPVATEPQT